MPLALALSALLAQLAAPDAGAARAAPREPPIDLSVPQRLAWVEVGQRVGVGGLPIRVYAARSKSKLQDLLQGYLDRFERAGYYLPRDVKLEGFDLPKVVAFDPENGWSYLVWGFPEGDGTTTLIIGAADVRSRPKQAPKGDLPVFPAAKAPVFSDVEAARMLAFTTTATEGEVIDFYRQVLPTGGFAEREPGTFVKDGRQVRVLAKRRGKLLSVVVLEQADQGPEPWVEEARKAVVR